MYETRTKALRWLNEHDLVMITYVEELAKISPYQIKTAAHQTFRFEGNTCKLTGNEHAFYRVFITDL